MKYLLVYIILTQVCSPKGTGYEAPPYFYMECYDTRQEAFEQQQNYDKNYDNNIQSAIIKGECGFGGFDK